MHIPSASLFPPPGGGTGMMGHPILYPEDEPEPITLDEREARAIYANDEHMLAFIDKGNVAVVQPETPEYKQAVKLRKAIEEAAQAARVQAFDESATKAAEAARENFEARKQTLIDDMESELRDEIEQRIAGELSPKLESRLDQQVEERAERIIAEREAERGDRGILSGIARSVLRPR